MTSEFEELVTELEQLHISSNEMDIKCLASKAASKLKYIKILLTEIDTCLEEGTEQRVEHGSIFHFQIKDLIKENKRNKNA